MALHRGHGGTEARDSPGAEVIAVAEAAGNEDHVGALEIGVPVPDIVHVGADPIGGPKRVLVAVAAGKPDDRYPLHQFASTSSSKSSVTGLASSRSHISRARPAASSALVASSSSWMARPIRT